MKKIISLLIILSSLAVGCVNSAMADFVVSDGEMRPQMTHEMMWMEMDGENNGYKCCFSPFKDSSSISSNTEENQDNENKWKILDIDFLAIIQENQKYNYLEKLTAPPNRREYIWGDNFYITLTWSIKSNC